MLPDKRPLAPSSTTPVVEAQHVIKNFGTLEVLKDVSFTAAKGDVVAIIGASGSGKSTLLRCLNLLERPDHGDLTIAGETIFFEHSGNKRSVPSRRQLQRLRSKVTMVFQQFNLWPHMTALGNVIEAPMRTQGLRKREAVTLGEQFLAKVGMADKRDEYPAFLSGGQQQRVAIARALAMQPSILLFDEPTSALDPELVSEVLGVIRGLAEEGRTMILVTHEMRFARDVSSQALFLHAGQIEARGSPRDIFENSQSERCRQFVAAAR
jgi:polar amino acid transport system ATP-binding protein